MNVKSKRSLSVVTVLFLVVLAGFAAKPLPNTSVISTIEGTGILADASIPNDRLQSDLLGDYFDGVEGVVSILQGNGDWELDGTGSSVRKVMLDLRETYDSSATPPFAYSTVPGRFIAKCGAVRPGSIGGMRGLNTSMICFMNLSFSVGRDAYLLTMNHGAVPDVDDVRVTCVEVAGNPSDPNAPCIGWTIDPSVVDSTGPRNRARLYLRGKAGTLVDRGRYYMRFHISFRK